MDILVDVYDPSGLTRLGAGPVRALAATFSDALDGEGSFSFSVSAADQNALELLENERQVVIQVQQGDSLVTFGRGTINTISKDVRESETTIKCAGKDSFNQLRRRIVGLNRQYEQQTLRAVAEDLITLAPGWSVKVEDGIADQLVTARFQGASLLKSLLRLAEERGLHIRLSSTALNEIEIGAFGEPASITAISGTTGSRSTDNANIVLIESISQSVNSSDIQNVIFPRGAGEGFAAVTLEKSNKSTPYDIRQRIEQDGGISYYLQDDNSVAEYGAIEFAAVFKDIAPVSNTAIGNQDAANGVYDAAAATLERRSRPLVTYRMSVKRVQTDIRPGSKIRVIYKGLVEKGVLGFVQLEINEELWVLRVSKNVSDSGTTYNLEVANTDRYEANENTILVNMFEQIQVRNLAIQTYPIIVPYTGKDTVRWGSTVRSGLNGGKYAIFNFQIDDFLTDVRWVRLRLLTQPVYITGRTQFVSPNWFTIFDVVSSPNYPSGLTLSINGQDVTAALGGPWNPTGNSQVDEAFDITPYILSAGVYQRHTLQVYCAQRFGDASLGSPDPAQTTEVSLGEVYFTVQVMGVMQAALPRSL